MRRAAHIRRIQAGLIAGLFALVSSASAMAQSDNGLVDSDFDFALGDLSPSSAAVVYGTLTLRAGGKVDANVWKGSARDPIPGMADVGRLSSTIEPEGRSQATDRGHKVVTNPRAFDGRAQSLHGQWWSSGDDICLQLDGQPTVRLNPVKLAKPDNWGALFRSNEQASECTGSAGSQHAAARVAPPSTVAVLSQRVFPRTRGDIKIKYQRFDGIMSRLNGWDPRCVLTKWDKTELHFVPGTFE